MIYLVRHGQTDWSVAKRHTGRTDVPLTDEGRRQAAALGRRIAAHEFALTLTSPLVRASETAALAGHAAAQPDPDLMELDYGAVEGLTTPEIQTDTPGWTVWSHAIPDGETLAAAAARVDRVIARANAVRGDVAIFAHGHILRILGARWIEQPPAAGARLALETASLSACGHEHGRQVLTLWNDTSHL